jgi:hypothetical protein
MLQLSGELSDFNLLKRRVAEVPWGIWIKNIVAAKREVAGVCLVDFPNAYSEVVPVGIGCSAVEC